MAPASGMQAWRNMSKSAYLPGHRLSQIPIVYEIKQASRNAKKKEERRRENVAGYEFFKGD